MLSIKLLAEKEGADVKEPSSVSYSHVSGSDSSISDSLPSQLFMLIQLPILPSESPGNDGGLLHSTCGRASGNLDDDCKKGSGFPGFSSHSKGTEAISLTGDGKFISIFGGTSDELACGGCELERFGLPCFSSHSKGSKEIWTGDLKPSLSASGRGGSELGGGCKQ